jgi:predicted Zn finger-like uncharacterized protein
MDIRCGNCSKLFRVADEKIAGKGIRFKCTKCGEIVTITKQDFEADLAARGTAVQAPAVQAVPPPRPASPPPPPASAPPVETEAKEYQPSPQSADEFEAQEYKQPETPRAGLDDFDFSDPHDAAQHAQQEDFGGGFSFDASTEPDQEASGEVSISEKEANEAEAAFSFPEDMISEPNRKPAFAPAAEEPAAGEGAEGTPSAEETEEKETGDALDLSALQTETPAQEQEVTLDMEPAPAKIPQADVPKGPVFTPPFKKGPSTPPAGRPSGLEPRKDEQEIDLAAALAIPKEGNEEEESFSFSGSRAADGDIMLNARAASQQADGNVHPLASGNLTGAVTGLGCGLPMVAFLIFGFGLIMKFVPVLSQMPFYHIVIAVGTGIFSMSVMIGILVAIVQARAGKKLFFLLNMLLAASFGAAFGAIMNIAVSLASGKVLSVENLLRAAVSSGLLAFLLSIALVIVRRILIFTKHETFSANLNGGQKAWFVISLVVVLFALYAQGSLTGRMEQSMQESMHRFQEGITPDGLTVVDPKAYIDPSTGDLVITGSVRNNLGRAKRGWYLEADVYDNMQAVVAKIAMANGIQILSEEEWNILQKRGKNIDQLRARMLLGLQNGEIPAKGSVPFEMHLMNPPAGVAGFLPVLKKYDISAAVRRMSSGEAQK